MNNGTIRIESKAYEAFIFDMDGLLFDTEKLCWNCFQEICAEYGYDPDFSIYRKCIGRSAVEGNKLLEEGFGKSIPYTEVNLKWNDLYRSRLDSKEIPLKEGVLKFLDELKNKNIKMAVATSTETGLALKKLERGGVLKYFLTVTGGDSVKESKPHPDIYLKAAGSIGADPKKCIAFEDSDNGVRAAHGAGMTVVQIPDLIEPSADILRLGHTIAESFDLIE
ncbi:MAG: HAD family phosphatase, partial [Candidatus Delongbacteria bacterium]|nr:HAD family phosphatase [Candidatus Delongbacteria bacterium]